MKVSRGQPWMARARCSMHWTVWSRGMRAFSDLRTVESVVSTPELKTVEVCQFAWLLGAN